MGKVPDAAVEFTQGYADFLQAPLQPLMDDLGSMTYEVFERDPVKYNQYEEVRSLTVHLRSIDDRQSRLRYKIYHREKLSECS